MHPPGFQSNGPCEGCRGWYLATQAAAATSEILAEYAESVQTFHRKLAAALRQSQPDTPEVTGRQRNAHQTAAQSCGRRYSEEGCYNQDRRARIQSTPQTDVARHSDHPVRISSSLFSTFSITATHPVQRSSPEGSLVHALDEIVTPPHHLGDISLTIPTCLRRPSPNFAPL